MRIVTGQVVIVTGASGGLGNYITEALAARGVKLALIAYPGTGLEELRETVTRKGGQAIAIAADLREPSLRRECVERVKKELGEIDILVNNAGVEFTSPYHVLSEENICDVLKVNLEAAMIMARLVLPDMLRRKSGHIVNISSLAGKASPALQEPYAATKAGLVALTFSLRASYRGSGVSASVIVPGFVQTGIYARLVEKSGCSAPALLGSSRPEKVSAAVLRAIEQDLPEVIINPIPVRPLLALTALCPTLGEWAIRKTGGHDFFRRAYEAASRKK
jgi:short-subunit dehydrogenase